MDISSRNGITFLSGPNSTSKDKMRVSLWTTSLHTLSEHCGYGDMRDQLIRDLIAVGIRDDKLSEKMQLDPDLTLEKAISLARQSEAVKKQQPLIRGQIEPETNLDAVKSRYKNKQQSTFQRKTAPRQQQVQKQHSGKCNRCGRSPTHNRNNCPARDATCHKCSKKGHYASVCKSRSTVGEVEDYGFLGEVNSNDSETWIINLKVKDTDIQFKIDTGADLSVVPEYVFKKLKNIKLVKADKILFGPGQKQLQVLGKFKCELKAKSAKSNQELYVVKGLRNSLLGRPAIQSLGLLLKSDVKNVDTVQEQYSESFSG